MLFATPDDVTALAKDVQDEVNALAAAFADCGNAATPGASALATAVRTFVSVAKRASRFILAVQGDESSGVLATVISYANANTFYEQGAKIMNDLIPLHATLTSLGCQNVPAPPSAPSKTSDPGDLLGGYGTLVGLVLAFLVLREVNKF